MLVHAIHTVGNGEPLKIGEQGHNRARAASSKDKSHCSTQDGLPGVERGSRSPIRRQHQVMLTLDDKR